MNFEQLRLQIHMRGLYERLGAQDAELLIVDAFLREQARNLAMLPPQVAPDENCAVGIPSVETRDSISKQQVL